MFEHAIVRRPCRNMTSGLTTAGMGAPDWQLALAQHDRYIQALKDCRLNVTIMDATDAFPDSCFIEDTCLVTGRHAVITRPGAPSRTGEVDAVAQTVSRFFPTIERIHPPGTLDAGDVMMAGKTFFIGLSQRTNSPGAQQLSSIVSAWGFEPVTIALDRVLHLKTGISYLESNVLLAAGEFIDHPALSRFEVHPVPAQESYAANSLWINGTVLVPAGFPRTLSLIRQLGYPTIELDMSEFQKLDGGLSCLSLRF